ncbi:MAG: GNAT family N-acetyltransferase [Beijerinckiaceae bacterium]
MLIRPCTDSDISAVQGLLVRTWHDTYDSIYGVDKVSEITSNWHSASSLSRQVAKPLSLFLLAELNGVLLGTSKATVDLSGSVKLDRLYVDPEVQAKGVGSALLSATLEAFPYATHVDLEVEPQNTKAVTFYLKQGFASLGQTQNCGGGNSGIPANTMRKTLLPVSGKSSSLMLRPVRDDDAQDLIGLITLCFTDYPGCFFDPHDDMPDIIRPAQSRLAKEGQFLVVEDARGRVAACVGVDFADATTAELHRLYVRPDMRGRGLAKLLTGRMEGFCRSRGASRMVLWSDTRFTNAHQLYRKLGYTQASFTRSCGDISLSREFCFERAL